MAERINDFTRAVSETPVPSGELMVHGAYPYRNHSGKWNFPVERVEPLVESFFRRSISLTRQRSVFFGKWDDRNNYFLTNSRGYAELLPHIETRGGVFIGPGMALPFTFAAWQGAFHAFVTDYDAGMPFGFTPLYGALLAMAPTRAHFVSLIGGIPITENEAESMRKPRERDFRRYGFDLVDRIRQLPKDTFFAENVKERLTDVVVDGARSAGIKFLDNVEAAVRLWLSKLTPEALFKIASWNESSFEQSYGGLLFSDEAYERERLLFMEGRVSGIAVDMTGPDMSILSGAIRALGQKLGFLYLSTVEAWVAQEDGRRLKSLYENVRVLPGIDEAVVVSDYAGSDRYFRIDRGDNYLANVMPWGLPPKEAARIVYKFLLLRWAIEKSYDQRLYFTDRAEDELPATDYFGGYAGEIAHKFPFLSSGNYDVEYLLDVFWKAVNIVYENKTQPEWKVVHERLMRESRVYRQWTSGERELFLHHMMYARFIKPSPPYVRRKDGLIEMARIGEGTESTPRGGSGQSAPPVPSTPTAPSTPPAPAGAAPSTVTGLIEVENEPAVVHGARAMHNGGRQAQRRARYGQSQIRSAQVAVRMPVVAARPVVVRSVVP